MDTTETRLLAVVVPFGVASFRGGNAAVGWAGALGGLGLGFPATFLSVTGTTEVRT